MRIRFPNPFGFPLPPSSRLEALCKELPIPEDYRRFLMSQNGLVFRAMAGYADDAQQFLEEHEEQDEPSAYPDLRALFGLARENELYDLETAIKEEGTFGGVFLPIGAGYGGDSYVVVLVGPKAGYVASLDHEMYAGSESVEAFAEEFEIEGFTEMSVEEKAAALLDENMGLAWLHAPSMSAFLESCVHCDEDFGGYVIDHPSLPS